FRDRRFHAHSARLMEGEARASRMAWTQSMDASDAARSGFIAMPTQEEIRELRAAHCKLQAQFIRALTALKSCQTQLTAALGRIHILEAARVLDLVMIKMAPKRTTRDNLATTTTTTTNSVTDAQLEALIEQGVAKFEKMETVFRISNYSVENQIKFSTCTLLGSALTWWNSHIMTVGPDAAYAMTWVDMKKKMTDKYCPRGEMKKLKSELWNLRVKINDEVDKIKRYVDGSPDVIHGSVVASRPKTMQKAIEMANELMDKRNNTWAECQAENKRKVVDTSRSNQSQQQQHYKRQNTDRAYTTGSGEKKPGTTNVNTANNQRGNGTGHKPTCYECGSQGHFRKDCPKFKNNNHGTQDGNATAPAKGNGSNRGNETRLNIILCAKMQSTYKEDVMSS
nr:hypothetical protein [Tanacetum cinerariifolium]